MSNQDSGDRSSSRDTSDSAIVHVAWDEGTVVAAPAISDQQSGDDLFILGRTVGEGTFGKVYDCFLEELGSYERADSGTRYALKVIRDSRKCVEDAMEEARILNEVTSVAKFTGHRGSHNIVRLDQTFEFRGYYCMLFESLDVTLLELLETNKHFGMYLHEIQAIAYQCLMGLDFLHRKMDAIHADIKPQNIMVRFGDGVKVLRDYMPRRFEGLAGSNRIRDTYERLWIPASANTCVKIIDFGCAIVQSGRLRSHRPRVICTRQYRPPEVVLRRDYGVGADVWGLGCVLAEIYTGILLFETHEDAEFLAIVEKVSQRIPRHMWPSSHDELDSEISPSRKRPHASISRSDHSLEYPGPHTTTSSIRYVNSRKNIRDFHRFNGRYYDNHYPFIKLLEKMLAVDPSSRVSAKHALDNQFFAADYSNDTD